MQTIQGLSAAFANRGCHLEKVTHQTRQSEAVENPPLAPRLAWLSDDRAIYNPDRPTDTFFEPVPTFSRSNSIHKKRSHSTLLRRRLSKATSEMSA